jgi:aspartate/methionine/tyrosine aminotransferase
MQSNRLANKTEGIKLSAIRRVTAKIKQATRQGVEISNLAAGRLDFDSPPHVKQATQKAMAEGWVHYADSMGREDLRETLARRLGKDFRLDIDPERIIITLGATEAMYVALQSILNPGDEVLVPQPMYVYYDGWIAMNQGQLVPVPLNPQKDFLLKVERVRPLVSPRTKALIINSPHNPTGQVFEEKDILAIARLAIEKDFYIVCDEIYSHLLYEGAKHFPVAAAPGMESRTIIAGSLSKTYAMDGWRLGYLICPQEMVNTALKIHQYTVGSVNTFVQFGARAALGQSQEFVRNVLAVLTRRRELMLSYLDEMEIPYVRPRGAFYVYPDISRFGYGTQRFSEFLFKQARVAVVPGNAFGPGGEGYVRMTYCAPRKEIEQAMQRMRSALAML